MMPGKQPNRIKPGMRMAGGLVGAILGGALGAGADSNDANRITCCKSACKSSSSR